MVTADEQRALQLENAETDARFWSDLHGMNAGTAEDYKGLAAEVAGIITKSEVATAQAASNAKAAQDRVECIKRGENVEGGLGKPMTREDWIAIFGWTQSDLRHMEHIMAVSALGEEAWEEYQREFCSERERRRKRLSMATARAVLRRRLHEAPPDKQAAARDAFFAFSADERGEADDQ